MLNKILIGALSASMLVGCSSIGMSSSKLSNEQKAIAVMDNLITPDKTTTAYLSALSYISDDNYVDHNLSTGPGKAAMVDMLSHYPVTEQLPSSVVRSFTDGDYVVLHSDNPTFGLVAFDVFRFEDGLIVEHWDAIQEKAEPNPSGRTQADGTTEVSDLNKTKANKALVKAFVQGVFVDGKRELMDEYINPDMYIQHNSQIGDGLEAVKAAFAGMAAQAQDVRYDKVHAVLGQGSMVLTVSEAHLFGTHMAIYDLFRVADGKIVEHWDVIEPVLPVDQRMNDHGRFNFPESAR